MDLQNTQTLKNLVRAYIAETHDGTRYQMLRTQATNQKQHFIANTLKQLSNNEMAHAKVWWNFITNNNTIPDINIDVKAVYNYGSGDFIEAFEIASGIEKDEGEKIYISFAKTARKEGFEPIANMFELVAEVERQHSMILTQIHDRLCAGTLYKENELTVWHCSNCGHEQTSKIAWKTCPLCSMPQGFAPAQIRTNITPQPNA